MMVFILKVCIWRQTSQKNANADVKCEYGFAKIKAAETSALLHNIQRVSAHRRPYHLSDCWSRLCLEQHVLFVVSPIWTDWWVADIDWHVWTVLEKSDGFKTIPCQYPVQTELKKLKLKTDEQSRTQCTTVFILGIKRSHAICLLCPDSQNYWSEVTRVWNNGNQRIITIKEKENSSESLVV